MPSCLEIFTVVCLVQAAAEAAIAEGEAATLADELIREEEARAQVKPGKKKKKDATAAVQSYSAAFYTSIG